MNIKPWAKWKTALVSIRLDFSRKSFIVAIGILMLWFCLVVDVFTIIPKRAIRRLGDIGLSSSEKLLNQWQGLYAISDKVSTSEQLGARGGVPHRTYREEHNMLSEYGHVNYLALCYPARCVSVSSRDDFLQKKPAYLVLDGRWPGFAFEGDPRPVGDRMVPSIQVVPVQYD